MIFCCLVLVLFLFLVLLMFGAAGWLVLNMTLQIVVCANKDVDQAADTFEDLQTLLREMPCLQEA